MVVILPVLVLVELVGMAFGGVSLGVASWFELTGLLWVSAIPFAILGVFVGFMVTAETAYPVVTALMFVLGYFGGLFNPVGHMSPSLQTAARILPSFHQASLGLAVLDHRGLGIEDALVLVAYAALLGLAVVWKHRVEESRGLA